LVARTRTNVSLEEEASNSKKKFDYWLKPFVYTPSNLTIWNDNKTNGDNDNKWLNNGMEENGENDEDDHHMILFNAPSYDNPDYVALL